MDGRSHARSHCRGAERVCSTSAGTGGYAPWGRGDFTSEGEQMFNLRIRILARTPYYWVGYRNYLFERKTEMSD